MENFDFIYDRMNKNYSDLEQIMGAIYQKAQSDPTDESNYELLQGLGEVAKNMIELQKEFTMEYGDSSIKEVVVANLDNKQQALMQALGKSSRKAK